MYMYKMGRFAYFPDDKYFVIYIFRLISNSTNIIIIIVSRYCVKEILKYLIITLLLYALYVKIPLRGQTFSQITV